MRRAALFLAVFCALSGPVLAQIVYQTGFESPTFTDGDLLGQDAWQSTDDPATFNRAVVQSALAQGGIRAVKIDASAGTATDYFWHDLSHAVLPAASVVQITWDMYLDGSAPQKSQLWGIEVFDDASPLAHRVSAVAVNASGIVQAWNGLTFLDTGAPVTRDAWHAFRVNLNYSGGAHKASVYVDNGRVAYDVAFGPGSTDTIADVDLWNLDGGGNDAAYYDNFSVAALADSDADGVPDADDACAGTSPGSPVDGVGCSTLDTDGDGVLDDFDACPGTPACAINVLANGCPSDTDSDTVIDGCDNCLTIPNGPAEDNQADADADGIGDACDACPNRATGDVSGDGLVDTRDAQRFSMVVTGDPATPDELCAADINDDTFVDDLDVPLFADLLLLAP